MQIFYKSKIIQKKKLRNKKVKIKCKNWRNEEMLHESDDICGDLEKKWRQFYGKCGGCYFDSTKNMRKHKQDKISYASGRAIFLSSGYTHGACLWLNWWVRLESYWIEMRKCKSLASQNISNCRRLRIRAIHHSCSKQALTGHKMNLMALKSLLCFQFLLLYEPAWCCVCYKCSWYEQN